MAKDKNKKLESKRNVISLQIKIEILTVSVIMKE